MNTRRLLLSTLILFMATLVSIGQNTVNFKINADRTGYVVPNSTKNYYVFTYPDKTQKELFDEVLKGIYKTGRLNHMEMVENSLIVGQGRVYWLEPDENYRLLDFTLQFEFKDGKIRINTPKRLSSNASHEEMKRASASIVQEVNNQINEILSFVCTDNDW